MTASPVTAPNHAIYQINSKTRTHISSFFSVFFDAFQKKKMSYLNDTNKRLEDLHKILSTSLELQKQTVVHLQEIKENQQNQLQQNENSGERKPWFW